MPNYEYKCKDCDEKFTVVQSILSRGKRVECPICGSENTEREISSFNSAGSSCSIDRKFG